MKPIIAKGATGVAVFMPIYQVNRQWAVLCLNDNSIIHTGTSDAAGIRQFLIDIHAKALAQAGTIQIIAQLDFDTPRPFDNTKLMQQ